MRNTMDTKTVYEIQWGYIDGIGKQNVGLTTSRDLLEAIGIFESVDVKAQAEKTDWEWYCELNEMAVYPNGGNTDDWDEVTSSKTLLGKSFLSAL